MLGTTLKRTTFVLALAGVLAGGALADGGTALKGPFAGAVHAVGQITYKNHAQKSWTWDRGTISALSTNSITLTRADHAQVSFALTSATLVRNDRGSYTLGDLKLGLRATVISQGGTALIVRHLRGEGAPSGAEQSSIEGPARGSVNGWIAATYKNGSSQSYSYDRGRIVSVGGGSLVIKRADQQQVTFTYDSSLVVREQGAVVGQDDLKVGERAMFFSQNGQLKLVRGLSKHA